MIKRWLTVQRLHLAIHKQIWRVLAKAQDHLVELMLSELLHTAVDAGAGSERAETAGDILFTIATTAIRGKLLAKLDCTC
jgi:neurofibromin 1